MKQQTFIAPEQSVDKLRQAADALSRHPKLIEVCLHASQDRDLRAKMLNDPTELLGSSGIDIPPELTIEFFEHPPRYLPFPDWTPFVFELTNCRTYWIRECDDSTPPICLPKEESVCFGFRLYPNLVQPGPVGLISGIERK